MGRARRSLPPHGGQRVVMDLASGDQRDAVEDEAFWCAGPRKEFDYRVPYVTQGEPTNHRLGGRAYEWCDVDGEVLDGATPPADLPNGVGTWVDDLVVVATPERLRAYSAPASEAGAPS